jgi:hypothetical protein
VSTVYLEFVSDMQTWWEAQDHTLRSVISELEAATQQLNRLDRQTSAILEAIQGHYFSVITGASEEMENAARRHILMLEDDVSPPLEPRKRRWEKAEVRRMIVGKKWRVEDIIRITDSDSDVDTVGEVEETPGEKADAPGFQVPPRHVVRRLQCGIQKAYKGP